MSHQFYIANFGCRTSQSEGAAIQEELTEAAAQVCDSPYQANVVIVNTCTVTAEADKEARQLIRRVAQRNPAAQIIVTGCYAQRAPDELSEMAGVRFVVGNSHKSLVPELTLKALKEDPESDGRAEVFCSDIFLERELSPVEFPGAAGRTRAVVKVQDGCNANCSFCVIPFVRGRSRSLDPEVVVQEVSTLVISGFKEVVFSGIHLGSYGRDLARKTSLCDLVLCVLESIPALQRLRLSSIEPLEVTPDVVRIVAENPRIANHLHIPMQSGSARILREMRRPYSPEYYHELIQSVRERINEAAIGADVMVGFPGETDSDFQETWDLISRSPLTYLHVFPFSSRPGTAAAELTDPVPGHVAQFRVHSLKRLIAQKNNVFRQSLIGRSLKALVLHSGEALSDNFVKLEVPSGAPVNEWISVRIDGLSEDGLVASYV